MNQDTQDTISGKIEDTTAQSGDKMSSDDVEKTTQIIETLLDAPELDLTETTLKNLISVVDNVQSNTEAGELRKKETGEKLRESAVMIVGEIAQGETGLNFETKKSVGKSQNVFG